MRQIFPIYITMAILLLVIKASQQSGQDMLETVEKLPRKLQVQLFNDLHLLKKSCNKFVQDVDIANESLQEQTKLIHELQMKFSHGDNFIDECEVAEQFLDLDSEMIKIKQKFQRVINENDDWHMDKLDEILHNVRRTSLECSMDGQDLFVAFQTNITANLMKFNSQIQRLEDLEHRLLLSEARENHLQKANSEFTILLNDIMDKLRDQEKKLENFELNLPLMVNATQSMINLKKDEEKLCGKQKCISKKILELTNNQNDTGNL